MVQMTNAPDAGHIAGRSNLNEPMKEDRMAEKFKACSIDGCNRNAHHSASGSKGLCGAHRKRLWRHGDPEAGKTADGVPRRFIQEVVLSYAGEDCLPWPYAKGPEGRGIVTFKNKNFIASRFICELVHGAPPTPKHEAAHNCGKGHLGCVNPRHLGWKTHTENLADKLVHGTHNRGERHWISKLTENDVRRIRLLKGLVTQRKLAMEYGVVIQTISDIHRRCTWSWLDA